MAGRPKGIKETKPRPKGAGRRPSVDYAVRYAEDPEGATDILLRNVPNSTLEYIERQAKAEGTSIQDWIRSHLNLLEINSRII